MNSENVDGKPRGNVISRVLGWPLRQLLRFALDHPGLLEMGTRIVSRIPFLYNGLLRYAQRNKIVLAPEDSGNDPHQISHPDQLTEAGKEIYQQLRHACERSVKDKA